MDATEVYVRALKVANYFLTHASSLSIDSLKQLDPTVEEIAKDLRQLSGIIRSLADGGYDDEKLAINAEQCCNIISRIATCVQDDDETELESLVQDLEGHIDAPYP